MEAKTVLGWNPGALVIDPSVEGRNPVTLESLVSAYVMVMEQAEQGWKRKRGPSGYSVDRGCGHTEPGPWELQVQPRIGKPKNKLDQHTQLPEITSIQ